MREKEAGISRLEGMLIFDPIQFVEDVSGKSVDGDDQLGMAALGVAIQHNKVKNSELERQDDTKLSNDLDRYLRIIGELGFIEVLKVSFSSPHDAGMAETFYIFLHPEKAILLEFDTYQGIRVNGGKFYYCWKESSKDYPRGILSSYSLESISDPNWRKDSKFNDSSPEDLYVQGNHDCREAIRYHMSNLGRYGTFINPWPAEVEGRERFLWLLHHGDTRVDGYDYKTITKERIAMMPEWARKAIGR